MITWFTRGFTRYSGVTADHKQHYGSMRLTEVDSAEQPKQYKYEKVLTVFGLDKDEMHNGTYGSFVAKEFCPLTHETEVVTTLMHDELYRRIELTPEQLHEQKVEGLARAFHVFDMVNGCPVFWDELSHGERKLHKGKAEKALEWMKQEGGGYAQGWLLLGKT